MNSSRHVDLQVWAQLILGVVCFAIAGLFIGEQKFVFAGFMGGLAIVNFGFGIANYLKGEREAG